MKKIFLTAIAVVFIGLLAACNEKDDSSANEQEVITPVETAKAEQGDLVIEKEIYGRTSPASQTPIMLQAPGEITDLEVENGDKVDENDLIATISGRNIYAPKSGQVANLTAEEGSIVSNSEPLAVIANLDSLKLQFNVTADDLGLFEKEAKHNAVIDGEELEAEVNSIGSMPNDTGLYSVEATINNEDAEILPGLVAVLHVPEQKVKDTIIVPTETIVEESGESFVYVVKDDQVAKINVTLKETQSNKTAIEGEVKKGDQVVTSGQLTLTDGSKVNVVKEGNKS
ncbi:efflux RND transporter periplasmic adaptor subunit [Virgibacillus ndiopensis]|uniref:efflux RND transporter periplasmic adaptor subunit n=1 Tax=Virgibacillus ndiopensis TaxID=2004408 RepID=UPI000C076A5A|nr:efflux RND transporter periplasmic adaptor subunit [Virgibacillus ndiopensis]